MSIKQLMREMSICNASDLFYRAGGKARLRIDGKLAPAGEKTLTIDDVIKAAEEITTIKQREFLKNNLDVDFALYMEEVGLRFRVSIFMQRNWPSIAIRRVNNTAQTFEELNLPAPFLKKLSMERGGLVLLTGSMGSGKSTTIASMLDYINKNARKHILTIEEPIEFTLKDQQSLVNQREIGIDVTSYPAALRAFTLQSPDVLFISNIRDTETMSSCLNAAETGVLVLSTLHTINAAQTVERIINFFPPYQHQEVRNQLSSLLKGVISLRLLPLKDGKGRVPAYEAMLLTPTISRLIREGKIWEIPQFIEDGGIFGMQSFTQSLVKLVREGKINEEEAIDFADSKDEFILSLRGIRKS
ncbi:MAG: PilT/PilU family type 4a pilus ATPase [Candidatus Omnitrophota bacterium]|nr:PilT/PilU family type 4a pilus ATPase [Candidatus Omnitrophota bacterium]